MRSQDCPDGGEGSCRKAIETIDDPSPGGLLDHAFLASFLSGYSLAIPADPARPAESGRAEQRTLADRAMAHLRTAAEAGYRDLAGLDKDADYDARRDREDFRLLRIDMAFPAEPFARPS